MRKLHHARALQQTAAVVLKRAAAATPQAFERATGLRVLRACRPRSWSWTSRTGTILKRSGSRRPTAYDAGLLADFARRQAAGEADLQAKFERPTRRDRPTALDVAAVARNLDRVREPCVEINLSRPRSWRCPNSRRLMASEVRITAAHQEHAGIAAADEEQFLKFCGGPAGGRLNQRRSGGRLAVLRAERPLSAKPRKAWKNRTVS